MIMVQGDFSLWSSWLSTCLPHLLINIANTVDKYRQVYCSEAAEQTQIQFQKYFTQDKLSYEF